jgi:hypothetical protein
MRVCIIVGDKEVAVIVTMEGAKLGNKVLLVEGFNELLVLLLLLVLGLGLKDGDAVLFESFSSFSFATNSSDGLRE